MVAISARSLSPSALALAARATALFLTQIFNRLLLLSVHPAGNRHQQKLERIECSRHLSPIVIPDPSQTLVNSMVSMPGPYAIFARVPDTLTTSAFRRPCRALLSR
jgi:hypothetical protein